MVAVVAVVVVVAVGVGITESGKMRRGKKQFNYPLFIGFLASALIMFSLIAWFVSKVDFTNNFQENFMSNKDAKLVRIQVNLNEKYFETFYLSILSELIFR